MEIAVKSHELRGDFFATLAQKGKLFLSKTKGLNVNIGNTSKVKFGQLLK